jgi:thiol-disulfide isomerase/thioredoxin
MGSSSSKASSIALENISTIELKDLDIDRTFQAHELWDSDDANAVIIYIIRRPGCPLCREQAELISDLVEYSFPSGVKLVGVVHEDVYRDDITTFKKKYFGNNPVYFDREKGFYKAQGNRKLGLYALLWPKVISAINRARAKKIESTTNGEGTRLGGLLVLNREKIWFEHREEYFGDLATIDHIKEAVIAAIGGEETVKK